MDGSAAASSAAVGFEFSPVPSESSRSRRSWRVSLWSEVRTWSSWTGAAVRVTLSVSPFPSSGEPAEPAREVDEEVALEEDARPDLGGRVLVERQAVLVDLHHHERLVGALLRLDRLDLADLDAGDPHRRVDAQAVGGLEHRVEAEAVGEGDVLGEAQEHGDEDDRERDQPDGDGAAAGAAAAGGDGHYFVPSVLFGCLPGTLPITLRPVSHGSLPASHSFVWPGAPVFGYGSECR